MSDLGHLAGETRGGRMAGKGATRTHLVEMLGGQIGDIGIEIKFMLACICAGKVAIQSEKLC